MRPTSEGWPHLVTLTLDTQLAKNWPNIGKTRKLSRVLQYIIRQKLSLIELEKLWQGKNWAEMAKKWKIKFILPRSPK